MVRWLLLILLLLAGCQTRQYQVQFVAGGDARRGEQLAESYGCGACHVIPDLPNANSWVGPPLIKWAERSYISGTLANNPENLIAWLQNPQAIHPNSAMPNLNISLQDARDISAFLFTLR